MTQLSIIVTSYNLERYIEQSLDSVLAQTLEDIEVIVVDDGSSDGTPEIIERFAREDPRIVPVLLPENSIGGVATAANAGLDRATAPYVGFVDGDDICEPAMFERLLDAALSNDSDLAMCKYKEIEDETGALSDPAEHNRWADLTEGVYQLEMPEQKQFLRFIAVPWRKIYRRELLETNQIRFPVGDYFFEDNPFHWFCILSATSIAVVPEVLCYHRVARAGQTMQSADERLFRIFQHHDTIRAWLNDRGLADEFGPTLLAWVISQMEWIARRTPKKLRRELFGILRQIFVQYDDTDMEVALNEGRKGQTARALTRAVSTDNFASFNRALDSRAKSNNPVVSAAYHLRHSGILETARISRRYAVSKLSGGNGVMTNRIGFGQNRIHNRDLMYALMITEKRLDNIEARLRELIERQAASEPE